jgi:phage terminase large subunit-like protein
VIVRELAPQPGPQTAFLACGADVVLYGGAAGGGKSFGLLLDALRYHRTPGWAGLILRAHAKDLTGAGSIFEEARKLFAGTGAVFRAGGQYVDVRWPSGATLAFAHLDGANVNDYQGKQYAWIGIDEATHVKLAWILYLVTRARTTCGTRAVVRMTCNPDPDHPLREWVDPYLDADGYADRSRSGTIRFFAVSVETDRIVWGETRAEAATAAGRPEREVKSFAFVASKLEDNPALLASNPDYVANLALAGRVEEQKLRHGNWRVQAETGGMLRRSRWGYVDAPLSSIVRRVRAWDKAATRPSPANPSPDFTVGVLLGWDTVGRWYVLDVVACREEPPEVDRLMRTTAERDGPGVTQVIPVDPGAAGKVDAIHTRRNLLSSGRCGDVVERRPTKDKVTRLAPVALALELGYDDNSGVWQPRGYVLRGPWLERTYSDKGEAPPTVEGLWWSHVAPFPEVEHDDAADALADAHAVGSAPPPRRVSARARVAQL